MHLDHYLYFTNEAFFDFEFESKGPKGTIRKAPRFTCMDQNMYNFGFGDLNAETGDISDTIVSNNGDANRIMATVARIIIAFTDKYKDALIYVAGNTQSRNRYYQININKYWTDINLFYDIFGLTEESAWEPLKKGSNYIAFLGHRRP